MGSEVIENLTKIVEALIQRKHSRAQLIIDTDQWVNERQIEVQMQALTTIATQQPTASDMRLIAATMEIAGELERIHDYIKGIGRISLRIGEKEIPPSLTTHMMEMAAKTEEMLAQTLAAYSKRDHLLCVHVPAADDEVDELYNLTYRAMIAYLMENNQDFEKAQQLEWAAHNLERSADRVTNICEWIVYLSTGVYKEAR
jgi:phosphate transport system protein